MHLVMKCSIFLVGFNRFCLIHRENISTIYLLLKNGQKYRSNVVAKRYHKKWSAIKTPTTFTDGPIISSVS